MQAQKLYDELMQKQLDRGVKRGLQQAHKRYDELMQKQLDQGVQQVARFKPLAIDR